MILLGLLYASIASVASTASIASTASSRSYHSDLYSEAVVAYTKGNYDQLYSLFISKDWDVTEEGFLDNTCLRSELATRGYCDLDMTKVISDEILIHLFKSLNSMYINSRLSPSCQLLMMVAWKGMNFMEGKDILELLRTQRLDFPDLKNENRVKTKIKSLFNEYSLYDRLINEYSPPIDQYLELTKELQLDVNLSYLDKNYKKHFFEEALRLHSTYYITQLLPSAMKMKMNWNLVKDTLLDSQDVCLSFIADAIQYTTFNTKFKLSREKLNEINEVLQCGETPESDLTLKMKKVAISEIMKPYLNKNKCFCFF